VIRQRFQRACSAGLGRVSDDWVRALPREKKEIFDTLVRRWECSFAMTSVALDDALSMRARGELVCAGRHVELSAVLLQRLSRVLISFCEFLAGRARFIREPPAVEPLNVAFFRGTAAQTAAGRNALMHRIAFGSRSRFINKLRILSNIIGQLDQEFHTASEQISKSSLPAAPWTSFDSLHYDFNTCLRETEVVLKSFLRALPADELAGFAVEGQALPLKRLRFRPGFSRAPA
jgi:hypothetical protein